MKLFAVVALVLLSVAVNAADLPPIAGEWKAPIPGMKGFYTKHVFTAKEWKVTQGDDTTTTPVKYSAFLPGKEPRVAFAAHDPINGTKMYLYVYRGDKMVPLDRPDLPVLTRVSFDEGEAKKILESELVKKNLTEQR